MLYVLRMLIFFLYRHECYFSVTEALELHFRKEHHIINNKKFVLLKIKCYRTHFSFTMNR